MDWSVMDGVVDLHIHAGPSVAHRSQDAYEVCKDASAVGYKAIVVKDHYFPSTLGTIMLNEHLEARTQMYGSICLNNSIGGINKLSVSAACEMGTKIVFMPTVSAKNHIEGHKKSSFVGAGAIKAQEEPIYYLTENGDLTDYVKEFLDFLSDEYPKIVLGTGHGYAKEIDKLIDYAVSRGLKNILVNHPLFQIGGMTNDLIKKWADMGCFIEINAVVFNEVQEAKNHMPIALAKELIEMVGCNHVIMDSDLGQAKNIRPIPGMLKFINVLHDQCDIDYNSIEIMCKKNPSDILEI